MRVTISALHGATLGGTRVAFATAIGSAFGVWKGPTPVVHRLYDVEFEVPALLERGADLRSGDEFEDATGVWNGGASVQGAVAAIEDDGTVILRVDGSILLLETCGEPDRASARVRALVPELYLYDTRT